MLRHPREHGSRRRECRVGVHLMHMECVARFAVMWARRQAPRLDCVHIRNVLVKRGVAYSSVSGEKPSHSHADLRA